jgi:AraC-like DNA-binding protein
MVTLRTRPPEGGIAGRMVLRVLDFAAARGHDAEALSERVGISLSALRESDARVPYPVVATLGIHLETVLQDPNWGLHLATDVRDAKHFDVGVLMLMASPNVRGALERLVRFQRYWGDGDRAQLVPAAGGACLRYVAPSALTRSARHTDECALAEVVLGVRTLTGTTASPRAVRFRHAAPRDVAEHRALFDCALQFDASHVETEWGDDVLALAMPHANATYCHMFESQVSAALGRLPERPGVSAAVRDIARTALSGGRCTLAGTARSLAITPRTLQRRLKAEQTSFEEVVEALRRELALAYLDQDFPLREVAWLLGYRDASAFHFAFKRWHGATPEQVRRVRRGSG